MGLGSQIREKSVSRIAIIGSCITRDLWPILGEAPRDLLYISRTSLPSLFAQAPSALAHGPNPPPALKRHQHSALVADLTKTALSALVAHQPTHIIFDFIDERFDLLEIGGGIVTDSWELRASRYLTDLPTTAMRAVPRLSSACELLWSEGLSQMAALIAATPLRRAKLILHRAKWADRYRDPDGTVLALPDEVQIMESRYASRADHNQLLDRYQAAFIAQFPHAERVGAGGELHLADANHRWGLSPFHYVDAYYHDIWRQLRERGV